MRKQQNRVKGQTLLEVMIATGVVGIVLVGIVSTAIVSLRLTRTSKERDQAKSLVINKLEQVRQDRDQDPEAFFGSGSRVEGPVETTTEPVFSMTTTYTDVGSPAGNEYKVTVEVDWGEGNQTSSYVQEVILSRWK